MVSTPELTPERSIQLPPSSEQIHEAIYSLTNSRESSPTTQLQILALFSQATGLFESTNRDISAALLIALATNPALKTEILATATSFAVHNPSSIEASRLAVSLLILSGPHGKLYGELLNAVDHRLHDIPAYSEHTSPTMRGYCRLLIEALGVPTLQDSALKLIHQVLQDRPKTDDRQRAIVAREVLHRFRTGEISADFGPLRELAYKIFVLGASHRRTRTDTLSRIHYAPAPCEESLEDKTVRAARLLPLLTESDTRKPSARLTVDDFRALGTLTGLSYPQFRGVCASITREALTEPSALNALLTIAKATHDESVTVQVRTSSLAAVVSEGRRMGKLSHMVERSVLATSAEIPHLYGYSQLDPHSSHSHPGMITE
jgi:hypothetical protein